MCATSKGECLWVVSDDEGFRRRAEQEVTERGCQVQQVSPQGGLDTAAFWKNCPEYPGALLLDVGEELDWATAVVTGMKRVRVPSPVIVATANASHEFGTKIVSLGVSYFLPRDFAPGELADVFISLVKPKRQRHDSDETPAKHA